AITIQITISVITPFKFMKPSVEISKTYITGCYNSMLNIPLTWQHTIQAITVRIRDTLLPFFCCLLKALSSKVKHINEISQPPIEKIQFAILLYLFAIKVQNNPSASCLPPSLLLNNDPERTILNAPVKFHKAVSLFYVA